jgi:zinc/manganese transport system substrate-binding protein
MKRLILCFTLICLAGTACKTPVAAPTDSPDVKRLQVVATYSILGNLVQNVAGERVDLVVLVGPDGDAHTYEPNPQDLVRLSKADLIFLNGLGFEPWFDAIYESSESDAVRVEVTRDIDPLPFDHADTDEEGDEEHGEFDPHVWHDVQNTISMVEVTRDELIRADPVNAEVYRSNANAYLVQLEDLDAWVKEQVATIPVDHRKLVTGHDTFEYFARAYGFEIVGTALGSATTEGSEPSAGDMALLIEQIQQAGVPAIFAENISNPAMIEQIAAEAGVKVGSPLYTDALGNSGSDGETYIKMIRYNVTTFVEALK